MLCCANCTISYVTNLKIIHCHAIYIQEKTYTVSGTSHKSSLNSRSSLFFIGVFTCKPNFDVCSRGKY